MLRRIPSIRAKDMESFFASIDSRLSLYDNLKDSPALLELVIWKSKIFDQFSPSDTLLTTEIKMHCRTDSISMVNIIVPNVMAFLTDGDDCDCVIDDLSEESGEDGEEDDDDSNWSDEVDDNEEDDNQEGEINFNGGNDDQDEEEGDDEEDDEGSNLSDEDNDNEGIDDPEDDEDLNAVNDDQENDDDGDQVSDQNDNETKRRRIAE
jgi:hypothetical protein